MARPLRIAIADGVYHVTSRGNAKQAIYLDDADRRTFLTTLGRVLSRHAWTCLGYCLMENHYHLLVQTPRPDLPDGMRQLNGVYAQRFNHRHDRCGHLFQARYSAVLVQRERHLLEAARYIALNPVRAGLSSRPEQWPWSSHRGVIGLADDDLVDSPRLLSHFAGLAGRYRAFVAEGIGTTTDPAELAGVDGRHPVERPPSPEVPRRQWQVTRPPLSELFGRFERDEAIVMAFRRHGYRMREIAEALGCHYATVSRRIKAWEDGRGMSDCKT